MRANDSCAGNARVAMLDCRQQSLYCRALGVASAVECTGTAGATVVGEVVEEAVEEACLYS